MSLRSPGWFTLAAVLALGLETAGVVWLRTAAPPVPTERVLTDLCRRLGDLGRSNGVAGPAIEIERVEGPEPDPYFETLAPALNERLAPAFGKIQSGAGARQAALARVGDLLKEKAWVHDLPDLTRTRPETLLSAQWRWVVPGERVGLTLRAVRLNATADGVSVFESFLHPRSADRVRRFHRRLSAGVAGGAAPALGLLVWTVVRSRRTLI